MLIVAPVNSLLKRLLFLALGFVLLVALNVLSDLRVRPQGMAESAVPRR